MTTLKPTEIREFWINFGTSLGTSVRTKEQFYDTTFKSCPDYQEEAIRVIEYRAYEQLKDENVNLKSEIKKKFVDVRTDMREEITKLREQVKDYEQALKHYCGTSSLTGLLARNVLKKWGGV